MACIWRGYVVSVDSDSYENRSYAFVGLSRKKFERFVHFLA